MVRPLEGRRALITGAGSGIGQATAVKFGKEGAKVVSCDINADRAQETAELVTADGGEATGYPMDVRDKQSIARVVEAVVAKYGRVDCLVNNAGIVQDATIRNMTDEQFDSVVDINLKGVFNTGRVAIPSMIEHGKGGSIILTSSTGGLIG